MAMAPGETETVTPELWRVDMAVLKSHRRDVRSMLGDTDRAISHSHSHQHNSPRSCVPFELCGHASCLCSASAGLRRVTRFTGLRFRGGQVVVVGWGAVSICIARRIFKYLEEYYDYDYFKVWFYS